MIYLGAPGPVRLYFSESFLVIRVSVAKIPVLLLLRTRVGQFHIKKERDISEMRTKF